MSRSRGNLLRNEARCKKSVTVIVMDPSLTGVICQLILTETLDSVNKPKLPLKKHEKGSTGGSLISQLLGLLETVKRIILFLL